MRLDLYQAETARIALARQGLVVTWLLPEISPKPADKFRPSPRVVK